MKSELYEKHCNREKSLELFFQSFRAGIIGQNTSFKNVYGIQKLLYADWIASGRLFEPIENILQNKIGPMVANTHSFSSETGKASTYAYKHARQIIKEHVCASKDDVLVTTGTGMTGALAHLQRIMRLKLPGGFKEKPMLKEEERPVVFISHMEHHSNHVSWMETIADVVIVPCDNYMTISPKNLELELKKYKNRALKIGAFTACSNVTGIITPYHELARVMHSYGGVIVVDFAASAPYVNINMHPKDSTTCLDAILFSPHKFLGGPGACGVLVFNKKLYNAECPDSPGGGNVKWTDPYGNYEYHEDLETKEDGGTPGFLQVMRAALAIRLKDAMGVNNIARREQELLQLCIKQMKTISGLYILGEDTTNRIGCISFGVENIHYNLLVRLLNDRFGIQVRGGWSCASTYGHFLFNLLKNDSQQIMSHIQNKDLTLKPGWVRLSLHPVTSNTEVEFICDAISKIVENHNSWKKDYTYNKVTNEFDSNISNDDAIVQHIKQWFTVNK